MADKKEKITQTETLEPTVEPLETEWLQARKMFLWLIPYGKPYNIPAEELKEMEPLLFYIDDERNVTVHTKFKTGKLEVIDRWGREKGYFNMVESRKRLSMRYKGVDIPIYIQYEKELYPYPIEPVIDAEEITKLFRILIQNYKMLEEKLGLNKLTWEGVKKWLYLIGGIILIGVGALFLLKTFGLGEYIGLVKTTATNTTAIINATNTTATNITTSIIPPPI